MTDEGLNKGRSKFLNLPEASPRVRRSILLAVNTKRTYAKILCLSAYFLQPQLITCEVLELPNCISCSLPSGFRKGATVCLACASSNLLVYRLFKCRLIYGEGRSK